MIKMTSIIFLLAALFSANLYAQETQSTQGCWISFYIQSSENSEDTGIRAQCDGKEAFVTAKKGKDMPADLYGTLWGFVAYAKLEKDFSSDCDTKLYIKQENNIETRTWYNCFYKSQESK